ncbi:hypothetical protein DF186_20390, partial [Enterococcus hirae]
RHSGGNWAPAAYHPKMPAALSGGALVGGELERAVGEPRSRGTSTDGSSLGTALSGLSSGGPQLRQVLVQSESPPRAPVSAERA